MNSGSAKNTVKKWHTITTHALLKYAYLHIVLRKKKEKNTFYLNLAAPINVIKYGVLVTCFRTLISESSTIEYTGLIVLTQTCKQIYGTAFG